MPARDSVAEPAVIALARAAMKRGVAALAAQDFVGALRWLDRAHRLVPHDPNAALTLASACLSADPDRAASLFALVAANHDIRQAWLGLAAARLRLREPDAAAAAMATVLSRYAFVPDTAALAGQIAGAGGWCGLRPDGRLEIQAGTQTGIQVTLDGKRLRGRTLPAGWAGARAIEVRRTGTHLLGSPIQITAIRRLAGCLEVWDGGLRGWAWHPADPETAPVLTLHYANGAKQTIVADQQAVGVSGTGPLARARAIHLTPDALLDVAGLIHIHGPNGQDVTGSPLDPFADGAAHAAAALRLGQAYPAGPGRCADGGGVPSPALRADAPVPRRPIGADARRRAATIVIPVHDGGAVVLACLASVLASVPPEARVLVVDDGSSDAGLIAVLDDLASRRKIALARHERAKGFPASANAGIRAAKGRDVVLLNSDTLVPPGWLERLRDAAYAAADIGTVTPLSNDASILGYPGPSGTNPIPDQQATNRLDRLALRANGATIVDIPVGVGFCLYLRRDCLNAAGVFRTGIFAQGYGEENDLCLRARRLGWRNVALTGLFVGHLGGATFGDSAGLLRQRNGRVIEQLHPGHDALIDRFLEADPLAKARRRIDLQIWRQRGRAWRQSAILISHNDGGGVERRLVRSVQAHTKDGRRPIVLRPADAAGEHAAIAVYDGLSGDLPNLVFAMPEERPDLVRLLRAAEPVCTEIHHLADYPPAIYDLVTNLGVPYDVHVHDYALFCPRIALVGGHNRYCGEPELPDCEACVADNGHFLKEDIGVAALRHRSARFLAGARRVVVPAEDAAARMRRHFTGLMTVAVPHEDDDAAISGGIARVGRFRSSGGRERPAVCVVGAIGIHKGFEVLLACARDAERRDLDLEFIVVGHTIDDARLMETGRVFVTGAFDPDEAVDLIAAQQAQLGFVPSVCPETWCLSLGDLWRAGLAAAAFDIGAPAERIRRTGRGIVLPFGMSANAINNSLVAAIRTAGH